MSKFRDHLKDTGQSLASFRKKLGISYSYMHEIASFKKVPPLPLAAAIEDATNGVIPVRYWIDERPKDDADQAADKQPIADSDTLSTQGADHA